MFIDIINKGHMTGLKLVTHRFKHEKKSLPILF